MLCHRVMPIVLLDGYSVVKSIQYRDRRNLGNPISVARVYNNRNVDELVLLDIDASKQKRRIDLHTVTAVASECFMPLSVGGGIRTLADIEAVLGGGADKVVLNTIALEDSDFIRRAASHFGSQCIVVSIDVCHDKERNEYCVYSHSGVDSLPQLTEWVQRACQLGAGEIVLSSVDRDGMFNGYELPLIEAVASVTSVPVIVSGGAGEPEHAVDALQSGASAIAAASVFHFTNHTPNDLKQAIDQAGFPVRLVSLTE
jgi:imidazole glycerol-phosphate synthase subunit HisF